MLVAANHQHMQASRGLQDIRFDAHGADAERPAEDGISAAL
jgi:hypothetical protein